THDDGLQIQSTSDEMDLSATCGQPAETTCIGAAIMNWRPQINGLLGNIDANTGDPQVGWDTNQFMIDIAEATLVMSSVVKNGGLAHGGFNFDAELGSRYLRVERCRVTATSNKKRSSSKIALVTWFCLRSIGTARIIRRLVCVDPPPFCRAVATPPLQFSVSHGSAFGQSVPSVSSDGSCASTRPSFCRVVATPPLQFFVSHASRVLSPPCRRLRSLSTPPPPFPIRTIAVHAGRLRSPSAPSPSTLVASVPHPHQRFWSRPTTVKQSRAGIAAGAPPRRGGGVAGQEMLSRREKATNFKPDYDIDIHMKVLAMSGQESSILTGYKLK
ncbi:hypothetical protein ACJX0J_013969, partial [Zea mays]